MRHERYKANDVQKKKVIIEEVAKLLVGILLIFLLFWFLWFVNNRNNPANILPANNVIKSPGKGNDIYIYPYYRNGITYLIFRSSADIDVINYTKDSIDAMIK